MDKETKRGFDEKDKKIFAENELIKLKKAHEEVKWLLDRNYKIDSVVTFVGNKYQFSLRQRNALKRATCTGEQELIRKNKSLNINKLNDATLNIDGFNLIIFLEVALSGGTLILGNDGNLRDLAGLRGTYKIIDKTDLALEIFYKFSKDKKIKKINFYIDSPISNSGRLKAKILDYAEKFSMDTTVELVNNADVILEKLDLVVSSDAVILDKCINYFNINKFILDECILKATLIDFLS